MCEEDEALPATLLPAVGIATVAVPQLLRHAHGVGEVLVEIAREHMVVKPWLDAVGMEAHIQVAGEHDGDPLDAVLLAMLAVLMGHRRTAAAAPCEQGQHEREPAGRRMAGVAGWRAVNGRAAAPAAGRPRGTRQISEPQSLMCLGSGVKPGKGSRERNHLDMVRGTAIRSKTTA